MILFPQNAPAYRALFWLFCPITQCVFTPKIPKKVNFSLNCAYNTGHFIGSFPDNLRCFFKFKKKITFFESKVNKVPCIIGAIWGKIKFLGIFEVLFDFHLLFDCDLGPRNYPIFVQIKTESQIPEIESHFWCKNTMDYWAKISK